MNRAVITGASGAVGYGLVKALQSNGTEVIVLGRASPKIEGIKFIKCELSELSDIALEDNADAFFHLAWSGTYGSARNNEEEQFKNVGYTLDAVRLAHRLGCRSFVGVGSQAEYGSVDYGTKLTPSLECHPQSFYAKAKIAACNSAAKLCSELGMKFNWCRIISAYGIGDKPYTMIMSTISKFINGESCDFTPCDQIWDYIYNEDLGRALLLIAQEGKNGAVYVAGSGQSAPLREYVNEIYRAVGNKSAKCHFGAIDYYENQAMYLSADIRDLTNDTGFTPEVSFDEGIRRTVAWYKDNIMRG